MQVNTYQVANILFSISGEGKYFDEITQYFSDKLISDQSPMVDLTIRVASIGESEDSFSPEFFSLSKSLAFNMTTFRVRRKSFSYAVTNLFCHDLPTEVVLYPHQRHGALGSVLISIYSYLFGSTVGRHTEQQGFVQDVANYNCLWAIFAITLMKKNCAFVHSGMMSRNKKGLILTGTGGCGKTSTMMELLSSNEWGYIAEDFGILQADTTMYDMQKKAAVYQSDIKWGNPILTKAFYNLSASERMEWEFKNKIGKNPVRYFKPTELFGNRIVHESTLEKTVFLMRTNNNAGISFASITSDEMAHRVTSASFREIREIYEVLCNIRAVGGKKYWSSYPSIDELENRYCEIVKKAFDKTLCYELIIPSNVDPKETASRILQL